MDGGVAEAADVAAGAEAAPPGSGARDWWYWWRLAVGLGLLVLLLAVVGPAEVVEAAGRAHPGWAAAVVVLALGWLGLGALNVWVLLRRLAPVPFREFVGVYITSWATALFIPGQLGDATQVVLLRRYDVPMSRSGAAYVVDKAVSLTWLLSVAAYGVTLYLPRVRGWWLLAPPALVLAALWLGYGLLRRLDPPEASLVGRARRFAGNVTLHVRSFRAYPGTLAANVALTGVKWLAMAGLYLWAFRAFGTSVGFVAAATIPVISSLVGYLPVTVGGAGTMEWTAVALFGGLGVDGPSVVVVYLFLRAILLAGALALLVGVRGRGPGEVEPSGS